MKLKGLKRILIFALMIVLSISAYIYLSLAISDNDLGDIQPEIKKNFSLVKTTNYNVDGQDKSLLEFNLKEKAAYSNNYYVPVLSNSVTITLPNIDNIRPSSVEVISISSNATNGERTQKEANYQYDYASGNVYIYANNNIDEDGNYYSGNSSLYDEYEIIANYDSKLQITDENKNINIPILIKYESTNSDIGTIESNDEKTFEISECKNEISTDVSTEDIYNGYINSNITNETNYETEYSQVTRIDVSNLNNKNIDIIEKNGFKSNNGNLTLSNQITYKQIRFNKNDMLYVLGENGYIQILDNDDNILKEINKDTDLKDLVYNFENEVNGIKIKTSEPVRKGIIRYFEKKSIGSDMKDINNKYVITAQKVMEDIDVEYAEIKSATTSIDIELDNTSWTNNIQNEVNISAKLVTSSNKYNLYNNPSIEIKLPENVDKVVLGDSYLLNANGLNIDNISVIDNEDGTKSIIANLNGMQTEYLTNNMIEGTNLVIPATIILNKEFNSFTGIAKVNYTNTVMNNIDSGTFEKEISMESFIESTEDTNILEQSDNIQTTTLGTAKSIDTLKEENALSVDVEAIVGGNTVAKTGTDENDSIQNGIIYERQIVKYEVKIKNNTSDVINNVTVIGQIPDNTCFATTTGGGYNEDFQSYVLDENIKEYSIDNIDTINPGETVTGWYEVKVEDLNDGIDGLNTNNDIVIKIDGNEFSTYELNNVIDKAKVELKLSSKLGNDGEDDFNYRIDITNSESNDLENVSIETSDIPKEITYNHYKFITEYRSDIEIKNADNKLKINIPTLGKGETISLFLDFKLKNQSENTDNEVEMSMYAVANINETNYFSNESRLTAYPQYVTVIMTLDHEGEKVNVGDELNYTLTVTNKSKVKTTVNILNDLPSELQGIEATYNYYDIELGNSTEYKIEEEENTTYQLINETVDLSTKVIDSDTGEESHDINMDTIIPAGKSVVITFKAKAGLVEHDTEVSNFATVSGEHINTVTSNIVSTTILTNIDWDYINGVDNSDDNEEDTTDNDNNDSNNTDDTNSNKEDTKDETDNDDNENTNTDNTNSTKKNTYNISGRVWLDENSDGQRANSEENISDIVVKMFNSETNSILTVDGNKCIVTTDSDGKYEFSNIPKGNYYCLFEYDSSKYAITTYKKNGIDEKINNDVSKASVTIDGVEKIVGLTDILNVENKNLTNIDMGLIENLQFDMKLNKYISKVTVQTSKETKEYDYDNASLAKVEIKSKYIEGSKITVEYKFVVTNEGNLAGYANEITDYLPSELEFSKESNSEWIVENDNYLKNTSLSSEKIEPGESKEIKLYLTKTMTKDSTGTIKNSAEITQTKNNKNIDDKDSTEGNKKSSEDDYSSADLIISISTGLYKNIATLIIIIVVMVGLAIIIKKNKKGTMVFSMIIICSFMMVNSCLGTVVTTSETTATGSEKVTLIYTHLRDWEKYTEAQDPTLFEGTSATSLYTYKLSCTEEGVPAPGQTSSGAADNIARTYLITWTDTTYTTVDKIDIELKMNSENATFHFDTSDNDYYIVGPYSVSCNESISQSEIEYTYCDETANTITEQKGKIYNEKGEEITWNSGNTCEFYVKVPKGSRAITNLKVNITIKDAVTTTKTTYKNYKAVDCKSINVNNYQNGKNASRLNGGLGDKIKEWQEKNDETKEVYASPVYAGSLKIDKRNSETDDEIEDSTAEFEIKNSLGDVYKTGVKIGEVVTGLPIDTYTVTEITAPTGYDLSLQSDTSIDVTLEKSDMNTTKEVKMKNTKYTNLEIKKVDKNDNTQPIENIGFTVFDEEYKKYVKSDGSKTDEKTILYTDSNGLINISNIVLREDGSEFTVTEVDSKNPYYDKKDGVTATIKGISNATTSWSSAVIENTKAYDLTIEKYDPDATTPITLDATFAIQYQDGSWIKDDCTYVDEQANIDTKEGKIVLSGIKSGEYHIYEVKTPTGYDITRQDGYDVEKGWVDCGTITVDGDNAKPTVKIANRKWISKITGMAWIDNTNGKANEYDYKYVGENSSDTPFEGLKVQVIDLRDNSIILDINEKDYTTTSEDGTYTMEFGQKILYYDLQNYVVRFEYDSETYTTVPINVENVDEIVSRVADDGKDDNWETDEYAEGSGFAKTITNASTLDKSIARYYNDNNYTIEGINLGVIKKLDAEITVYESLNHVLLKKDSYEYSYRYSEENIVHNAPEKENIYSIVNYQKDIGNYFELGIYPSDVAYNFGETDDKFEVYVVYDITILNSKNVNLENIYVEEDLNVTKLKNIFNSEVYELADDNWTVNDNEAIYNEPENGIGKIGAGSNKTVQITFKVTEKGLKELVQKRKQEKDKGKDDISDVYMTAVTTTYITGYHDYSKNDYSWKYDENNYVQKNEHKTRDEEDNAYALTLKLFLNNERTISGNVFEDTQTAESNANGTRIGDGKFDATTENKIKGVTVELLDASDSDLKVASLYNIKFDNTTNTWIQDKTDATTKVDDYGNYSISGIIPGEYYLRFIYDDGTTIVTNSEGIKISEYKSTILSGYTTDSSEFWFLGVKNDENKNYSVATDKYYIDKDNNKEDIISLRTTSTKELNYSENNNINSGKILAESNKMKIQFEYTKDNYIDYKDISNLKQTLDGMNFGIIERPHTKISIDKTIENIKITASNGTVLVNGNPDDQNISSFVTKIAEGYAKMEYSLESLYGAVADVQYAVTLKNESEIDFAEEDYYKYGTKKDNSKLVKTTVNKVINYMLEGTTYTSDKTVIELGNKDTYLTKDAQKQKGYIFNAIEINVELTPEKAAGISNGQSSVEYKEDIQRLLANTEENDDIGINNYGEIVGITNATQTSQYEATSGNYVIDDKDTSEYDNGDAIFVVCPPTGKERYIEYLVAITVGLIVMIVGIVVIKKKVL